MLLVLLVMLLVFGFCYGWFDMLRECFGWDGFA